VSVNIKQLDGTLKKVAGNTILLDGTCSEIQSGTITIPANTTEGKWTTTVTMPTTMTDTDYIVIFNILPVDGTLYTSNANYRYKTTTSFIVHCVTENVPLAQTIEWYAFRLVELEGYNTIYNKMTNIDSTPTDNSINLVTSGGVYDAIKNASSVFIGTSSEWESETSKTDYQVAILTDKPNVNAVDSTDGSTTVVGEPNKRWVGSQAEWEQLKNSDPDKAAEYEIVCITDDSAAGGYFTPTTISTTGATVSQGSATIDSLNCVRSGNIVAISGALDVATLTNGSGTTTKLTLPNAVPAAMILTTGAMGYWGGEVDEAGYCQITDRTLTFFSNGDNASVSNVYVRFSVTYICQ